MPKTNILRYPRQRIRRGAVGTKPAKHFIDTLFARLAAAKRSPLETAEMIESIKINCLSGHLTAISLQSLAYFSLARRAVPF
ncbi:MAG: hypothetical protein IPI44_24735 [Sulfuritalea sp.]|nr:hypothetical protein [Sulfuritalea sp.]